MFVLSSPKVRYGFSFPCLEVSRWILFSINVSLELFNFSFSRCPEHPHAPGTQDCGTGSTQVRQSADSPQWVRRLTRCRFHPNCSCRQQSDYVCGHARSGLLRRGRWEQTSSNSSDCGRLRSLNYRGERGSGTFRGSFLSVRFKEGVGPAVLEGCHRNIT